MKQQDMIDLLRINDAVDELDDLLERISGTTEGGLIGDLRLVSQIIARNSSIWDRDLDFYEQEIGEILDQRGNYEERDRRLMGR